MKAITLWQPWATLMALGVKTIETRSWQTSFRGELVIHAAQSWSKEQEKFFNTKWVQLVLNRRGIYSKNDLPFGAALCTVYLQRILRTEDIREIIATPELYFGNYEDNRFAWITEDCKPFKLHLPCRGRQGLWNCDPTGLLPAPF